MSASDSVRRIRLPSDSALELEAVSYRGAARRALVPSAEQIAAAEQAMSTTENADGFRIVRYSGDAGPAGRIANLRCNDCEFGVDVALLKGNRTKREAAGLDYIRAHVARHAGKVRKFGDLDTVSPNIGKPHDCDRAGCDESMFDPCPTCHDPSCNGCVTGHSDSIRDRESEVAVERWRIRTGR